MGDDTIYSGTVAAATEGYLLGIPSIAVSLTSKEGRHFETAGRVARELVERFARRAGARSRCCSTSTCPISRSRRSQGREVTRLGKRHKAEAVVKTTNPRGETVYWIGAAGEAQDAGQGTDFHAVAAGRVSITPLQMDLTHPQQIALVKAWLRMTAVAAARHRHDLAAHARPDGRAAARSRASRTKRCSRRWPRVPRHVFVDEALASRAYEDAALPIGFGQTISRPYTVARMIEAARAGRASGACSRSAPGAATRRRCSRASRRRRTRSSASRRSREKARANLRPLRIANLRLLHGDGYARPARSRAVRRDRRRRGGARGAESAARPARARRAPGDPGRHRRAGAARVRAHRGRREGAPARRGRASCRCGRGRDERHRHAVSAVVAARRSGRARAWLALLGADAAARRSRSARDRPPARSRRPWRPHRHPLPAVTPTLM